MAYDDKGDYERGNAYREKEEYDRAIADCNQAIRLDPNDADAYNNRDAVYVMKENYARAD
ncbi:MAG: tetratricopeptide repeat protein [Spirochaetaceae bacterium]|nr:tetratricopeptide repeat protein [Spirochaetaceae bacterium]